MFWQTELAPSSGPSLDDLLNAENVNLDDVIFNELTIQEIRNGHEKLANYLTSPNVISELVLGALKPRIDTSLPEKEQYKRAHQCAEILSLNNEQLSVAMLTSNESKSLLLNFLEDDNINNLIASFYMKIISQLLSKCTDQFLDELSKSDFVGLCLKRMQYSAVAELLYRIVNIPSEVEQQFFVRQWYTDCHLAEGLNDLLVPELLPEVHDNVGYLWSELVRLLREVQYTAEDKRRDALMESLQSERNIRILMSRMLPDDPARHCDSVKINAASILITLLETNFVPNCPSHQLGTEERGEAASQWIGGQPQPTSENELNGTLVWQPDAGRVVETIVAASTDKIINAIIDSLQKSDDDRGALSDAWYSLMQLLVQVLNTNHAETHQSVLAAFSAYPANPIHLLFAIVFSHPLITVFHQLFARSISFILYTMSNEPSPLIAYLFKDVDLIGQILNAYANSHSTPFTKLARMTLRTFYINLAITIRTARLSSPNAATIDRLIKETEKTSRWDEFFKKVVSPYEELNKSDDVATATAGMEVAMAKVDNAANEAPSIHVVAQQAAVEFSQYLMTNLLPENTSVPFPSSSTLTSDYNIPIATVDLNPKQDWSSIADEATFEALCELRIDPKITSKKSPKKFDDESWPGASDNTSQGNSANHMNGNASNSPPTIAKTAASELKPKVEPFAVSWDQSGIDQTSAPKSGTPATGTMASAKTLFPSSRSSLSDHRSPSPAAKGGGSKMNRSPSPQVQAKVTFATNDEHSNTFGNSTSSSFAERFVDEDPWPSSSTSSGTSTENSSDAWANFSMKTSDWPPKGVEHDVLQNDANGWPSLSGQSDQTPFPTHIPGLPVADGIACAIISAPVVEKPSIETTTDSSEC